MDPNSPIQTIPHTSSITFSRLKKAHILTWLDLLKLYPNRYLDFRTFYTGSYHELGSLITVKGTISSVNIHMTKNGKALVKAKINVTDSVLIDAVWFNQPFLKSLLHPGMILQASGAFAFFNGAKSLEVQEYEVVRTESQSVHTGRMVPLHPQVAGISARTLREKIWYVVRSIAFDQVTDIIPKDMRSTYDLMTYPHALSEIHFPTTPESAAHARRTLAFYELFDKLLQSALVKREWQQSTVSIPITLSESQQQQVSSLIESLPFKLTDDQHRAVDEVIQDLARPYPMNRFLQGDVGSGKTIVAAIGAYAVALAGRTTLCMAPTEILAQQHFVSFQKLLKPLGVEVELVTSQSKVNKKDRIYNQPRIFVGTQALLFDTSNKLEEQIGLIIIDEQHRFGVKQRAALKLKGKNPHLLTMTATPIPRTISLVLYNELDVSVLNTMPMGRKTIKTYGVPPHKRSDAYIWIKNMILKDHTQAYIVCPLIETSDSETLKTVKAASLEYEHLSNVIFPELKVGLLHGKCKPLEKQHIMEDFYANRIQILVSTSVVEVGVDVPNATVMIIEGAERFGLAQLHQLRGRVGRGDIQSHCLLFTSQEADVTSQRLQFFAKTTSGMSLAEFDLKLRGPGEIYGATQHGYGDLKLADLTNFAAVAKIQHAVAEFMKITHPASHMHNTLKKNVAQISRD